MAGRKPTPSILDEAQAPPPPPQPATPPPAPAEARQLGERPTRSLVTETRVTYERVVAFVMPHQRQWLDQTSHALNLKGIGSSDVIRLALDRLRRDAEAGAVDLAGELIDQAYREAEVMPGRKNRGLPPRRGSAA